MGSAPSKKNEVIKQNNQTEKNDKKGKSNLNYILTTYINKCRFR
jgi:hypothetical protein